MNDLGRPKNVVSKKLSDGTRSFYWAPNVRVFAQGFLGQHEALGADPGEAFARAEVLNRRLEDWRLGKRRERKSQALKERGLPPQGERTPPAFSDFDAQCVYVIATTDGRAKVGVSKDVQNRLQAVRTGCPSPASLRTIFRVPKGLARRVERKAHRLLKSDRSAGEWFVDRGHVEAAVLFAIRDEGVSSDRFLAVPVLSEDKKGGPPHD